MRETLRGSLIDRSAGQGEEQEGQEAREGEGRQADDCRCMEIQWREVSPYQRRGREWGCGSLR